MAPIHQPAYRYGDPTLTAPPPGRALIETIGLVESLPGIGPKTGGNYLGIPLSIGPLHTRLHRPYDGIDMTLPNTDLKPCTSTFYVAAHARGCFTLAEQPGWHWLRWTVAEHLAHDAAQPQRTRPLVIVPCGATKLSTPEPVPAGQLYTGTYHRLGLRAAAALTDPSSTRILSALHGLLPLDRPVTPYNLRLGQPGAITTDTLRAQAAEQNLLEHPDVVLFGGRDYVDLAHRIWPHARTPLAGTRGIGEQQQRLAAIAAGHLN
ncbi:YaaA family protein [Prescottella subtropica]|uniref:YaaA family protein n=1 Tax=Prescottella subtropica TaxID=2545757 RepID=UPI001F4FFB08|nr:YaaA family protein [Prescottella subtropica]